MQLDLIVALAEALRDADGSGKTRRSRVLLATLRQELHLLGFALDPAGETCPALIHSNGRVAPELLATIGVHVPPNVDK